MSSALLAGSLFAIVTAPLAVFSSQPLSLELQGKTLFSGKLEDVASLYVGVAAVASVGVATLAGGSSRKRGEDSPIASTSTPGSPASPELSLFDVPVQSDSTLSAEEALSPLNLKAAGLDFFLEGDLGTSTQATSELSDGLAEGLVESAPQKPEPLVAPPVLEHTHATKPEPQAFNPVVENELRRSSIEPSLIEQHCGQKEEPEQSLVLEGWAQAFLSDRPLVPLESSSPVESAPALESAPVMSQPQMPQAQMYHQPQVSQSQAIPTQIPAVSMSNMSVPAPSHHALPVAVAPTVSVVTSASGSQPFKRSVSPVMPAAQTYLSFTHSSSTEALYSPEHNRNLQVELEALEKLEQVREQIQVLSAQMEMLQSSLSLHGYSAKHLVALPSAAPQPSYTVSAVEVGPQDSESQHSQPLTYIASPQRAIAS